jgi:uroporphyrinogen-III synthase
MTDALKGKKILVTRPARQADHLCALIEQAGGVPIRLPAIDIQPIVNGRGLDVILSGLREYACAIFVSRNAVLHALPLLQGQTGILAGLRIIALGEGTAAALSAAGLQAVAHGGAQADSEALLALPLLQEAAVRNKRIIIFRGTGGRELLADTLRARGAHVDYAEVYQRTRPHYEKALLDKIWLVERPAQMVVTSSEALHNLFAILGPEHRVIMLDTGLVVIGARMAILAQELGFRKQPAVADATDEGLLQALIQNS